MRFAKHAALLAQHRRSSPWWLAGGVDPADCFMAVDPEVAGNLASSYTNLNNPGTNNVAPGTAPTLSGGWVFNGSTQYLLTNWYPHSGCSILVKYTYSDSYLSIPGADSSMVGFYASGSQRVEFRMVFYGGITVMGNGGIDFISGGENRVSGVAAMGGRYPYFNGSALRYSPVGTWGEAATYTIPIGCRRRQDLGGSFDNFTICKIKKMAIYEIELTADQVLAITEVAQT